MTDDITQSSSSVDQKREEARAALANRLLCSAVVCILISLLIGSILVYLLPEEKIDFRDVVGLVQAIATVFSGLLGAAIAFYFSAND